MVSKPTVYSIPAPYSFADTLAQGLLAQESQNPEKLASYLILLPTRRACRVLQDAFLRCTDGKPLLLPRLQPIGDIDEDELKLSVQTQEILDIPPAISPLKRSILLAQIISKLPGFSKSPAQDIALAKSLGQLLDQIYTEDLDVKQLPELVDREKFANHWQITLDFLNILTEHWPQILKEQGVIDAGDRRTRLINALNNHWQNTPPAYPVIAAGSTGSIPSTRKLLKTISQLDHGSVVLPAIDQVMDKAAWDNINETHPQATLKELIEYIGIERESIENWQACDDISSTQEEMASHIMLPASQTSQWQRLKQTKQKLDQLTFLNCDTTQEEAQIISIILRETLEDTNKTAALITPDRDLAKRVSSICHRWNIDIDDSAGKPLSETKIGSFISLSAQCCIEHMPPSLLLSFLKHDLCRPRDFDNFRKTVRLLDQQILRGIKPDNNFIGIKQQFENIKNDSYKPNPSENILDLIQFLELKMNGFYEAIQNSKLSFKDILKRHLELLESFCSPEELWAGEGGEAASNFFKNLQEETAYLNNISPQDYIDILSSFMYDVSVRPKYGTHPRLMILGQLEARLLHTDRVILAGLNEGTWPADSGNDPWMSRPMRKDFGLPSAERGIGLSAHDFVQGFCAPEVFLMRSKRANGTPTVPSRWLQRMETVLKATKTEIHDNHSAPYFNYLKALQAVDEIKPIDRPAPTPPIDARPTQLSVTRIEKWLQDPYSIYADKILKLKKLEPLEKEWGALETGNILHRILERFIEQNQASLKHNAYDIFMEIAKEECDSSGQDNLWESWQPRLHKIANWFIEEETKWRHFYTPHALESKGEIKLTDIDFTLEGRADRIDRATDGSYTIMDYKSGGQFSLKGMVNGKTPQLALEALILEQRGFPQIDISESSVSSLSYWQLSGGSPAGKITNLNEPKKLEQAKENALHGLTTLVQTYSNENTPYYSIPRALHTPRFNDYEHLARIQEWAALDDQEDSA